MSDTPSVQPMTEAKDYLAFVRTDSFGNVLQVKYTQEPPIEGNWIEISQNVYDSILACGRRCTYINGVVTKTIQTRPLQNLTPRQFELMLLEIGITWQDVVNAIDAKYADNPDERAVAHVEFNRATEFRRSHWAVEDLAAQLGFPKDQLDSLWRRAATFR